MTESIIERIPMKILETRCGSQMLPMAALFNIKAHQSHLYKEDHKKVKTYSHQNIQWRSVKDGGADQEGGPSPGHFPGENFFKTLLLRILGWERWAEEEAGRPRESAEAR